MAKSKLFLELNEHMVRDRFKFKKDEQAAIINENLIQDIVKTLQLKSNDRVFEMHKDTNFLTREIEQTAHSVTELKQATKVFWLALHKQGVEKEFMHIIQSACAQAIVLVPELFGDKLAAEPGFPDYSELAAIVHSQFTIRPVRKVKSDEMHPQPSTQYVLLNLQRKKKLEIANENIEAFYEFLKTLFRVKNKNLGKVIQELKWNIQVPEALYDVKIMLLEVNELEELFYLKRN